MERKIKKGDSVDRRSSLEGTPRDRRWGGLGDGGWHTVRCTWRMQPPAPDFFTVWKNNWIRWTYSDCKYCWYIINIMAFVLEKYDLAYYLLDEYKRVMICELVIRRCPCISLSKKERGALGLLKSCVPHDAPRLPQPRWEPLALRWVPLLQHSMIQGERGMYGCGPRRRPPHPGRRTGPSARGHGRAIRGPGPGARPPRH